MFHADVQTYKRTDRHDQVSSRFSQFCERAYKGGSRATGSTKFLSAQDGNRCKISPATSNIMIPSTLILTICACISVPPDITDEETSSDITVQEGENATLVCHAAGHPTPRILWRREDGESLILRKSLRDVTKGKRLHLILKVRVNYPSLNKKAWMLGQLTLSDVLYS